MFLCISRPIRYLQAFRVWVQIRCYAKVSNQNGGFVISVRLIFKRWVISYFKIVFICRCCGNCIDTINFIDILTSYVCLLFIYLTMNTIYGSVSKWRRRHFWQMPRKQFRPLETREKALKYAISKYAIWKNIAHFPPMQSNRNNIKVYNKIQYLLYMHVKGSSTLSGLCWI